MNAIERNVRWSIAINNHELLYIQCASDKNTLSTFVIESGINNDVVIWSYFTVRVTCGCSSIFLVYTRQIFYMHIMYNVEKKTFKSIYF